MNMNRLPSVRIGIRTASALLAIGIAAASVVLLTTRAAGQKQPDPARWITQPDEWVPISYEVQFTQNNTPSLTRLIFQRSSDGSTRTTSMAPAGVETVEIDSVPQNKHFRWTTGGKGSVHPLRTRPNGGRPFGVISKSRARQIASNDPRVTHLASLGMPLTFWEFVGSSGARVVFCPELNLLDVHADLGGGRIKKVMNVVVGEPPANLFVPPADVAFEARSEPEGSGRVSGPPSLEKRKGP
jgi:hypothetical protein